MNAVSHQLDAITTPLGLRSVLLTCHQTFPLITPHVTPQPIECRAAVAWEAEKPLDVTTVTVAPPQVPSLLCHSTH